jgi:hypothetical protein
MAEVIKRQSVPTRVSGQTLVITSLLIFSHVFSLPSALEVRMKEVTKKATVSTEDRISGTFRDHENDAAVAVAVGVLLLELILSLDGFICSCRRKSRIDISRKCTERLRDRCHTEHSNHHNDEKKEDLSANHQYKV